MSDIESQGSFVEGDEAVDVAAVADECNGSWEVGGEFKFRKGASCAEQVNRLSLTVQSKFQYARVPAMFTSNRVRTR